MAFDNGLLTLLQNYAYAIYVVTPIKCGNYHYWKNFGGTKVKHIWKIVLFSQTLFTGFAKLLVLNALIYCWCFLCLLQIKNFYAVCWTLLVPPHFHHLWYSSCSVNHVNTVCSYTFNFIDIHKHVWYVCMMCMVCMAWYYGVYDIKSK